ncbi:MAG: ATP-binding protein, partial [Elusimicrobiota bacterium]
LANRKTKEILGREGEQIEGRPLEEILPEEGELKKAVLDVVSEPGRKIVKEVDLSTDEKRLFVRLSAHQLLSPAKQTVLGVVTAIHDVTLEMELDKMKEEFLHSITHDLRNPLGSILGFLEFLRKGVAGVLNAQQKSMVDSMLKSSNRLLTMVNNILDVAKMESGKVEVRLKEASISGLASHSLEILGSLAQRRAIELKLDADEEFTIPVDASQIERVITNLVGNAIKFAPDDGHVVARVKEKDGMVEVCVQDDGPGIPATHIEKVFGKFEQVPGQKRGGTGLGLTISKRFVEAHC